MRNGFLSNLNFQNECRRFDGTTDPATEKSVVDRFPKALVLFLVLHVLLDRKRLRRLVWERLQKFMMQTRIIATTREHIVESRSTGFFSNFCLNCG